MSYFGIPLRNGVGLGLGATTGLRNAAINAGASLSLNFQSATLDSRITFSRTSNATLTGSDGLIQTAAINAPRFDYDPTTLACKGLLIEEQRTNLLLNSADFSTASYSNSNVTVTNNSITAPDGTTTGNKLQVTATATTLFYQQQIVTATSATGSIYVKKGSSATNGNGFYLRNTTTAATLLQISVNFDTKAITYFVGSSGAAVFDAGNGWLRIQLSVSSGITSGNTIRFAFCYPANSETAGIFVYAWGDQLETGSFATSYIPTVASQVTRAADFAIMTGTNFSSWYNAAEGTVYSESSFQTSLTGNNNPWALGNGSSSNDSTFLNSNYAGSSRFRMLGYVGSTNNIDIYPATTYTAGSVNKAAFAYAPNNFGLTVNASAVSTDTSGVMSSAIDRLSIGSNTAGTSVLSGTIKKIVCYPQRVTNNALQVLTA